MTLLEQAKEFAEDCDLYNYPIEAMAEFAESVTPKWTYCEDAMPSEPSSYLATYQWVGENWSYVTDLNWDGAEWEPLSVTNDEIKVIAWMPLPDPATEKMSQSTAEK